jgi:hypothetical protein
VTDRAAGQPKRTGRSLAAAFGHTREQVPGLSVDALHGAGQERLFQVHAGDFEFARPVPGIEEGVQIAVGAD